MTSAPQRSAERALRPTIVVIGNPNTGKSTLFNALTGLRQQVGNFPGVTVERKLGTILFDNGPVDLIDLPGTYSLAAQSPDEMIAVDVLLGQQPGVAKPTGILAIVDASNLQRNLYLISQLLELQLPLILVLNMTDIAARRGHMVDPHHLSQRLGVPVIVSQANQGVGLKAVREALHTLAMGQLAAPTFASPLAPACSHAIHRLVTELQPHASLLGRTVDTLEATRILIDTDGFAARRLLERLPTFHARLQALRALAVTEGSLATAEASARYAWIRRQLLGVVERPTTVTTTLTDRIDRILTHKVAGSLLLGVLALIVFQSIYRLATPLMDLISGACSWLGAWCAALFPAGPLQSLVQDGIIGGVGAVLVFLPQIAILFTFIAVLEDCGYMARAAFLMDRVFAKLGLSGKSFIPLLSSFACAVPGIMATRTIENRRDRLATILVAPLMSCSARLPIYILLIATFIPATTYFHGWIGLQGLTLLAMHLLGLAVAIPAVWCFKRTVLRGATPPFVMELPPYKVPSLRLVGFRVYERVKAFVQRAGTIILAMAIVVWACAYFPHPAAIGEQFAAQRAALTAEAPLSDDAAAALANAEAGAYLQASYFGRLGQWIEPVVRPLGWDWRIGMAALASFPAREVVIATLGTIFNVGSGVDEASEPLQTALRGAKRADGRPLASIPVALSLMIFFALCCQCMATVATIRRETNSWGYALGTFGYMTALAYVAAWGAYQIGVRL
ncbi:MAG: ferrous iron transport protein B [Deltaproteobacteria bacterium]|nr:ferrous iron transport protein B [Deltaproteobacteria bacterium]